MSASSVGAVANRLGALALVVADRVDRATRDATGRPSAETAALIILTTELRGASQNTLGRVLALTQTGTTRLVARLVRDGLLEQRPGADARTHALVVTSAGEDAARRALTRRAVVLDEVLAVLDDRDLGTTGRVVDLVLGALTDGRTQALRCCRLCDTAACGHPQDCPVTLAAKSHGK